MPASWRICSTPPRAPEWAIRKIGLRYGLPVADVVLQLVHHLLGDLSRACVQMSMTLL